MPRMYLPASTARLRSSAAACNDRYTAGAAALSSSDMYAFRDDIASPSVSLRVSLTTISTGMLRSLERNEGGETGEVL